MAIQSGNWRAVPTRAPARGPARGVSNNALLNPSQPLSGQALAQAAQALANAQTSGPLAALAQQIASNNRGTQATMKLAGGFYNQLGQQAQQGVTNERGIASDLNSTLQGISNQTNQQLQGLGQSAQDSLMRYAPQGEGGLSTAAMSSLASEIARQKGLAAQQEGASQMFGANQGANYSGLAAANQGTQALAGTEGLTKIGQSGTVKNQPLMNQVASLNAQKGSLYATDLGKLRQQEINNQITRSGLGIKSDAITAANNRTAATILGQNQRSQASIQGQNTRNAASIKAANQRSQNTIAAANQRDNLDRGSREAIAAANRAARSGTGGAKPLSTVQNDKALGSITKIQDAIRTWQQDGFKDKTGKVVNVHPTNAQMRQILGGGGYPPYLIQAAFELLGWGIITPPTARAMHAAGIRGGTYRNQPIRVQQPPPGPNIGNISPGGLASPH